MTEPFFGGMAIALGCVQAVIAFIFIGENYDAVKHFRSRLRGLSDTSDRYYREAMEIELKESKKHLRLGLLILALCPFGFVLVPLAALCGLLWLARRVLSAAFGKDGYA